MHWQEDAYVRPPTKFVAQANLKDASVFDRFSLEKFPECFREYADLLDWYKTWDVTLDTSKPPFWRWFVGGRLNASYNCVDRHLPKHKNKTAIHFVPEPEHEAIQHVTYQELYAGTRRRALAPSWLRGAPGARRVAPQPSCGGGSQRDTRGERAVCLCGRRPT